MTPNDPIDDLPDRVVVGKNGAYWRNWDTRPGVLGSYSMCPVSTDNDPIEPVAVYVRDGLRVERLAQAMHWAAGVDHTTGYPALRCQNPLHDDHLYAATIIANRYAELGS